MMEQLLPRGVASFTTRSDDLPTWLFPVEQAQMDGAVGTRLREFATARSCARLAINKLGLPTVPILRGAQREPIWPAGIVGSITHCDGFRAAAVARKDEVLTLGIDAEPHEELPLGVREQVCSPQETAWLSTAPTGIHWDRLLFSAKESIFKAWFPLTHKWLDFNQATVSFQPDEGTFEAKLTLPFPTPAGPTECLNGRFLVRDGLIITAIVILL
jgi:4'-phosphopantetheinyl transferase EntD